MTSLQAKKILGKKYKSMSDFEIEYLLNQLYSLAEMVSDTIILNGSNKTAEVIDQITLKEQNGNK